MSFVPPGSETGLYHIPIAGLPWNTSWQTLKDFARNHPHGFLNIERAVVYQNPTGPATDGWVSIRGYADFRRALNFLNGGILNGQSLLADGRNEWESIILRDPHPITSTQSSPRPHRAPSSSTVGSVASNHHGLKKHQHLTCQPLDRQSRFISPSYTQAPPPPLGIIYAGNMSLGTPVFVQSPLDVHSHFSSIQPSFSTPQMYSLPTSLHQGPMPVYAPVGKPEYSSPPMYTRVEPFGFPSNVLQAWDQDAALSQTAQRELELSRHNTRSACPPREETSSRRHRQRRWTMP